MDSMVPRRRFSAFSHRLSMTKRKCGTEAAKSWRTGCIRRSWIKEIRVGGGIMAELIIHQDKIPDNQELIKLCPFGAMERKDGKVTISAACKMCRLCVRKGPKGAVEYVEDAVKPSVDKSAWKGIAVYVDHVDGKVHPVTLELLGKREPSKVTGTSGLALFMEMESKRLHTNCFIIM